MVKNIRIYLHKSHAEAIRMGKNTGLLETYVSDKIALE